MALLRQEWKTAVRFLLVGSSSFAVKALAYALVSRVLWPTGSRSVANILAMIVSVIYNYSLHRVWTFRIHKPAAGSFPRYIGVVIGASVVDAGLFYVLHELVHVSDWFVLVFNAGFISLFTFSIHRWFTFHDNPWKR